MKYILTLAAAAALLAGCASQGGTGTGSATTDNANPALGMAPAESVGTPSLPTTSPGNDRNDTGTTTGTGVSDLGAASPGDQLQREPYDPRVHRR